MNKYNLNGKLAVITGASDGIGFGIAKSLSKEDVNLVLVSRNEDKLKKAAEEIKAISILKN